MHNVTILKQGMHIASVKVIGEFVPYCVITVLIV